ncbi:MAG: class B sortase [Eubacterium sp.]|nr:class B sortase [Eubacterium sp.]
MRKRNRQRKMIENRDASISRRTAVPRVLLVAAILAGASGLTGCGSTQGTKDVEGTGVTALDGSPGSETEDAVTDGDEGGTVENQPGISGTGIDGESAQDALVDFAVLKEENPEIFAWLYVPGTEIDVPVLQSMQGDDYYETHNASGEEDADGAVYIELANLANMCDFNTVMHGKTRTGETGPFAQLYQFADPDFFKEHEQLYVYLDGNVLTYEIFAAYERENTSLLRTYDFTYLAGCEQFLNDLYGTRDLGKNLREGWEGLTPYQFLITLTTRKNAADDRQMVVVAVLTADAAGTVSRVVTE